jgi:hypothetical protein
MSRRSKLKKNEAVLPSAELTFPSYCRVWYAGICLAKGFFELKASLLPLTRDLLTFSVPVGRISMRRDRACDIRPKMDFG